MKQKVQPQRAEDFVYRFIQYRNRKKKLHFVMESVNTSIKGVRTVHAIYEDKGFRFGIDYQENKVCILAYDTVRCYHHGIRFIIKHTESTRRTTKYF